MNELKRDSHYYVILEEMRKKHKHLYTEKTLHELKSEVLNGYTWQSPKMVQIPKSDGIRMRDIFIFEEENSFVQKTINHILTKNFNLLVSDCVFSYKKGVSTFNAAKHIQRFLKSGEFPGMKVDIDNYFMSVSNSAINQAIDELISDTEGKDLLKSLLSIDTYEYKGELHKANLGIMPGCAISSFLANYLLKEVDSYLKSSCITYARYSDDLIFFCESEEKLEEVVLMLKRLLSDKGLKINSNKMHKLNSKDKLEFLGLQITKDYIDISDVTFKKLKDTVKSVCKGVRNKQKRLNIKQQEFYLVQAINKINNVLYRSIIKTTMEHKSGRVTYAFGNITRVNTLLELDYYIKDCLRYVYTGKHNKANSRLVPTERLKELGYVPILNLYNLYKMDRDVFYNELALLNIDRTSNFNLYVDINQERLTESDDIKLLLFMGTFENIYLNVLEYGYFIFNDKPVYAEALNIDIVERTIRFGDILIAKENKVVIQELFCKIQDKFYHIILKDNVVSNDMDTNPSKLLNKYLNASITGDYSRSIKRVISGFKAKRLFRNYSLNEVASNYDMSLIELDKPYEIRYSAFMCYLYGHLVSNTLWEGLDYSKKFIKYKEGSLSIILKREWIGGY